MSTVALEYSQPANTEVGTVGDSLRQRRQQLNMSMEEAAKRLNLPLTTIDALENDRFSTLNSATYCQGYLCAYARLLQLDEHGLLKRYRQYTPASVAEPVSSDGRRRRNLQSAPLLLAISGLLLLCLISFFFREQVDTRALPRANTNIDQSQNLLSVLQPSVINAPATTTLPDTVLQATPPPQPFLPARMDQLTLSFSGDCWVEIEDANGDRKVSRLLHAGDTLQLRGQSPFKVLLGYAPVVTLRFNGEPVSLSTSPSNHLARVVVGRS